MFLFHRVHPKKISVPALILTLLFSALAGSLFVDLAAANPVMPDPVEVHVYFTSPVKSRVYSTTEIPLQFHATVEYSNFWPDDPEACFKVLSVRYWLDGSLLGEDVGEDLPKSYSMASPSLSDGEHNFKVWVKVSAFDKFLSGYSDIVSFRVDAFPPEIRFLATQMAYVVSDVALNFTVNKPVCWLGYSLDGNAVVEVTDDLASTEWFGGENYRLVLEDLPGGVHGLTVFADDAGGNRGESEPFSFTVTEEAPSDEQASTLFSASTAVALALIASAAIIAFGLVAYFLRHKKRRAG
jgi:hypothetical protein